MYSVEWWDEAEEVYEIAYFSCLETAIDCAYRHGVCVVDEDGNEYW